MPAYAQCSLRLVRTNLAAPGAGRRPARPVDARKALSDVTRSPDHAGFEAMRASGSIPLGWPSIRGQGRARPIRAPCRFPSSGQRHDRAGIEQAGGDNGVPAHGSERSTRARGEIAAWSRQPAQSQHRRLSVAGLMAPAHAPLRDGRSTSGPAGSWLRRRRGHHRPCWPPARPRAGPRAAAPGRRWRQRACQGRPGRRHAWRAASATA